MLAGADKFRGHAQLRGALGAREIVFFVGVAEVGRKLAQEVFFRRLVISLPGRDPLIVGPCR